MIFAGNQPYFFPYIGYWQLINAVDVFAVGDFYKYKSKSWITRNQIAGNGEVRYFNINVQKASIHKNISEIAVAPIDINSKMSMLHQVYRKAPYYESVSREIRRILEYDNKNLVYFLKNEIETLCEYMGIETKIVLASELCADYSLDRNEKIYQMCRMVGADTYINAIGGQELYEFEQFRQQGITLQFLKNNAKSYSRGEEEYVEGLSIIDVLMYNSKEQIREMLKQYTLIGESYESSK